MEFSTMNLAQKKMKVILPGTGMETMKDFQKKKLGRVRSQQSKRK